MFRLSGNQLKIIAMVTMTLDHIGLLLLPQFPILRILGRLAMPIYAYMIAEGCRHTRSRKRYFLRLFGLGLACQVVYFVAMGSLYQCILITFSLSVALICLVQWSENQGQKGRLWLGIGVLGAFFLCVVLPDLLPHTDFAIDYGIWGVLLPLFVYCGADRKQKLIYLSLGLCLLGLSYGGVQWFALGAVPLLGLYSGQRGTYAIGKFFYLYYPIHLVVLEGLGWILS